MQQLSIGPGPAGTLLVAGNPDDPSPTVIQNVDTANTLYLGKDVSVNPSAPFTCAPLYPGQTTIASGDVNIFGIASPGQTVAINVYEGMMSFFQPVNLNNRTLLGGYFISGSGGGTQWQNAKPSTPGFYLYYDDGINPPVLAFAISIAPGSDQWGNTWPGGQQIVGLPTLTNVFTVIDTSGNTLVSIDSSGNISGQTVNATNDLIIAGNSFFDIIYTLPLGIVNRGWAPLSGVFPWPSTTIGTTELAVLELDQVLSSGRAYKITVLPTEFNPTATANWIVQRLRGTTDGSTPTTSSPLLTEQIVPVNAAVTTMTSYSDYITPSLGVDTMYRLLLTAFVHTGTFQYGRPIEMRIEDIGPWQTSTNSNNGITLGSGGSGGGGSKQTYTKTYNAVEFASYYGSTASYGTGPNSQRSHNSTCYQGCSSGQINGSGDQYSFARFNYGQIATDLGAGVINWVKLRITNQHSWYNSGCNAIIGWTTYTGAFGGTFTPGGGTHMAQEVYSIGEGATKTRTMGAWLANAITSGFTSIVMGTSASYSSSTDLNNYGYFAGAGSTSTCQQLQINYTK